MYLPPRNRDPFIMNAPPVGDLVLHTADLRDTLDEEGPRWSRWVDAICEGMLYRGRFIQVVGHPVDIGTLRRFDAASDQLLVDLPEEVLRQFVTDKFQRGYGPRGAEHSRDNPLGDHKRYWMTRLEEWPKDPADCPFGPNVWPDDLVPAYRPIALEVMGHSVAIGRKVLRALEDGFSRPKGSLVDDTYGAETIQRDLTYDPQTGAPPPDTWRSSPHEDINKVTVMPAATDDAQESRPDEEIEAADGLDILVDGKWYRAVYRANAVVVDTGEMIGLVPGFESVDATTHRVRNPPADLAGRRRRSRPTFVHGRHSSMLYPGGQPVLYRDVFLGRIAEITGSPV